MSIERRQWELPEEDPAKAEELRSSFELVQSDHEPKEGSLEKKINQMRLELMNIDLDIFKREVEIVVDNKAEAYGKDYEEKEFAKQLIFELDLRDVHLLNEIIGRKSLDSLTDEERKMAKQLFSDLKPTKDESISPEEFTKKMKRWNMAASVLHRYYGIPARLDEIL